MSLRTASRRATFALAAAALAWLAGCATAPPPGPVHLRVLAINDLHGNLLPPGGGLTQPSGRPPRPAGGVEHLATALAEARAGVPHHVFVAAGDLIGATPLLSAMLHDEPTIEVLTALGLEAAAIGNHELDRGAGELLRMQNGGCHPNERPQAASPPPPEGVGPSGRAASARDVCKVTGRPFKGAGFKYLAANTIVEANGQTLLPPYWVKRFAGIPVAFVGMTTKDTPSVVVPSSIAGLHFRDEADTVNALVPDLKRQGIEAIVVLLHEGGLPGGDFNECPSISGPIVDLVKRFDKAVDVVVSGHTHRAYNCRIDGRLVTSADRFGTVLTRIDLTLDPQTRDVVAASAENVLVSPERYAKHAPTSALVANFERIVAPLAKRPVGRVAAPLVVRPNEAGESPLGRVIADAQLAATRDAGAQVAFMNIGGVRAQLGTETRLDVSYEDLFAVQPFYNQLVTMTLSGAQLLELLEQQWSGERQRIMLASRGFAYAWDAKRPVGQRVVPGSVTLDGKPIDASAAYRVTVNSFMASGGDGYTMLRNGRDRRLGILDIDAFEAHVKAQPVLAPDAAPRITRLN